MTKTVILHQIKKPNCILSQGGVQFHHQTKLEKLDIERQFPWCSKDTFYTISHEYLFLLINSKVEKYLAVEFFFFNLFCSFFLHLWYFGPFLSTRLTLRRRSLEYRYGNLRIFFVTQYFPFSLSSKIFRDKLNLFQEVEDIIPLHMIVHVQIIFSMEAIFKSDFQKPNRKVNSRLNFTLKESFLIL